MENKHDIYSHKDCMKKYCGSLREHAMERIDFTKKEMSLLTIEQQKSYQNGEVCYILKEKLEFKMQTFVIFGKINLKVNMLKIKFETIIFIQGSIEVLHITYVI